MKSAMRVTLLLSLAAAASASCKTLVPGTPPICHTGYNNTFYQSFAKVLPKVGSKFKNDLELWMPGLDHPCDDAHWPSSSSCHSDHSNKDPSKPYVDDGPPVYWTWVSKKYLQPIVSGVKTNACGKHCPNEVGRACKKFQTCCINNVTHDDFTGANLDRGHQVPNGLMGMLYYSQGSTFNMCNIGPQTKRLNEADWMRLEHFLECLAVDWEFFILAGPLFDGDPFDHCVCHYNTAGVKSCDECKQQYPDGSYKGIPVPDAYWKIAIFPSFGGGESRVFTWIFDKSQTGNNNECLSDVSKPPCGTGWQQPAIQSIQEAYKGAAGLHT